MNKVEIVQSEFGFSSELSGSGRPKFPFRAEYALALISRRNGLEKTRALIARSLRRSACSQKQAGHGQDSK
jgi:hypothetical protein